ACTAIEPGLDPGAGERVLEEADVFARGTEEDRDLVKTDAGARFIENPTRDLDALASFSRRGKELNVTKRLSLRRLFGCKEVSMQCRQVRFSRRLEHLDGSERAQTFEGGRVTERKCGERFGSALDQSSNERELDRRVHRHVEQQERDAGDRI